MIISKYLQKDRTPFFNLKGWTRYTFEGTYNGSTIMYSKSQIYDPIEQVYRESFVPVSSWTHVKVTKNGKIVLKLNRLMMQFRIALSQPRLKVGDRVSFTAKVREYIKGGRFTGDLLSVIKNVEDVTQRFEFKQSRNLKKSDVMAHLLWDNDNPYNFAYLSWQSPLTMARAIRNYYQWFQFNDKPVSNEATMIISILEGIPFQYAINGNGSTASTYINFDGFECDTSKKSLYQLIKPLNDKAHLITPSKMNKLKASRKPITDFYILLKGLHRAMK